MNYCFLLLLTFAKPLALFASAAAPGQTAVQSPPPLAGSAPPAAAHSSKGAARTTLGSTVRLTVTFATAPVTATARLAPTLYNKARVLNFEEDDSPQTIFTEVYPLFHGGVARNGELCPGLRYTDGCNNSRPYVGAVAINGHNTYNNTVWLDPGPNHDAGKLVWSQAQQLLDHGWDIENHSDWHTEFVPLPAQQLASLDELIASRLKGYRPSVHIVPTNYAGYPTAAFNAGYVAVSSASQGDNLPMFNAWDEKRVALSALPVSPTPFVFRRYSADASNGESAQTLLTRLKAVSDALMAPGNPASEVYVQRVFAHAINFNVLRDWMNYTQSIAGDKLWVTTLREMEEYRRVRKEVVKQEALSGNTLTVDLDYSAVGANIRFQNLTLLVDSPGTITDIKVTGADSSSYNVATKQVNIFHTYRRDIVPLPVQLSAFTARRAGAGVQLNWHTATELNSREFEVQRSANGVNFSVTGTVPAAGTTSMPRSYSFLDASVPANTSMYYRLRQVDTDGASHYSPVVQVAAVAPQGMRLWVAPNPATVSDGLTVTVVGGEGQVLRVQLLDALGRTVRSEVLRPTNGQQDLHLSLPESTKDGVYILRVVGAQQLLQTRVLLTR